MKARCSKLGMYMACPEMLWRDLNAPQPSKPFRNQYMSFGTIVHYEIQKQLGVQNLEDVEEPCDEDYIEAEPMLHNSTRSVTLALEEIKNRGYAERAWMAEEEWENGCLSGHTDLCDGKTIIDIKTISKPPARRQIKVDHYWQLLGYHYLTGATDLRILYVSSKGEWAVLSEPVDLAQSKDDVEQMLKMLRSPERFRVYGSACTNCIHVGMCRDATVPSFPEPTPAAEYKGSGAAGLLGL